ncbi:hypothetical protein [Streptomyces sp. NBC_00996]|uniref:hypothetical protein n=1 Tax=Streptomyces sp. NBC_00996 TaxID=2903710 RepID=UPI003868E62B|nr:hypothetical protein OG390_00700 [Streptomyces sp. NBC_00996]
MVPQSAPLQSTTNSDKASAASADATPARYRGDFPQVGDAGVQANPEGKLKPIQTRTVSGAYLKHVTALGSSDVG